MNQEKHTLHGNAPDWSDVALLIIDMINDLEFPDGDKLLEPALRAAQNIKALKQKCQAANIPCIYVNDNFGRWRSDFNTIVDRCREEGRRGQPVAEYLIPDQDDYFVLKPKHSGFYSTVLDILLEYLGTKTLIITGVTADICVYFTASDAYMRDFAIVVPSDCVACVEPEDCKSALENARRVLKADTTPSDQLDLKKICHRERD